MEKTCVKREAEGMKRSVFVFGLLAALFFQAIFPASGGASERLKGIACRSVHLQYPAPEGVAFYNEVTVEKSSEGTYFCVCGFRMGYFGMQELWRGKKVLIFSVWEPGRQQRPDEVEESRRAKCLFAAPDVRVRRFGHEGTGGQSFFDYDWETGRTYRFFVAAEVRGERTAFAAYFYLPEKGRWKHLVTFSTLAGGKGLRGYYSFVEDFRRNRISATKVRKAYFGNGWVKTKAGRWAALTRARFTADSNPVTNINAGVEDGRFFLATGGETRNTGAKLWSWIKRPSTGASLPPDLPLETGGN